MNNFNIFRFKELYMKNGTSTILLEMEKDNNLKNIQYTKKLKDVYIIDLETDVFKNEQILKIINIIYNEMLNDDPKDKIINKEIWNKYLEFKSDKEKIYNEEFGTTTTKIYGKPIFNECFFGFNKDNHKYKNKFIFPKESDYEQLYIDSETGNGCYEIRYYEFYAKNEEEYAFYLLNTIFNSNIDLKIKSCENCKKPFLTNTLNTKNCLRKNEKNLSCRYEKIKIQKQHQYDDSIKHLIKNIRDLYENKPEEKEKFNYDLIKYKEKYYGDNKSFVLWLLSHYKTEEKRQSAIERLNLAKYL